MAEGDPQQTPYSWRCVAGQPIGTCMHACMRWVSSSHVQHMRSCCSAALTACDVQMFHLQRHGMHLTGGGSRTTLRVTPERLQLPHQTKLHAALLCQLHVKTCTPLTCSTMPASALQPQPCTCCCMQWAAGEDATGSENKDSLEGSNGTTQPQDRRLLWGFGSLKHKYHRPAVAQARVRPPRTTGPINQSQAEQLFASEDWTAARVPDPSSIKPTVFGAASNCGGWCQLKAKGFLGCMPTDRRGV